MWTVGRSLITYLWRETKLVSWEADNIPHRTEVVSEKQYERTAKVVTYVTASIIMQDSVLTELKGVVKWEVTSVIAKAIAEKGVVVSKSFTSI